MTRVPSIGSVWEDNGYGYDVEVVGYHEKDRIEVKRLGGEVGIRYADDDVVDRTMHETMNISRFEKQFRPQGPERSNG